MLLLFAVSDIYWTYFALCFCQHADFSYPHRQRMSYLSKISHKRIFRWDIVIDFLIPIFFNRCFDLESRQTNSARPKPRPLNSAFPGRRRPKVTRTKKNQLQYLQRRELHKWRQSRSNYSGNVKNFSLSQQAWRKVPPKKLTTNTKQASATCISCTLVHARLNL